MRISIQPGQKGMPRVVLQANDGARAEVYLNGAHVTSWIPAGGEERLFLSSRSEFAPGWPIRGGIPICFPQFAGFGPLPKHGFARTHAWELSRVKRGVTTSATFTLRDTHESRALWPHHFSAEYTVAVRSDSLRLRLVIHNSDAAPFTFSAALHTYLAVLDVTASSIDGLTGVRYLDTTGVWAEGTQSTGRIRFAGEVDLIYYNAPAALSLHEAERSLLARKFGFKDVVVWNPGPDKSASLGDLHPDDYRRFVCIEAAIVGQPAVLAPGREWSGEQVLQAHDGERRRP